MLGGESSQKFGVCGTQSEVDLYRARRGATGSGLRVPSVQRIDLSRHASPQPDVRTHDRNPGIPRRTKDDSDLGITSSRGTRVRDDRIIPEDGRARSDAVVKKPLLASSGQDDTCMPRRVTACTKWRPPPQGKSRAV